MKRIGLISDTHGTFDQTLKTFLKDVDEIWHAGDIGSPEVADQIAAFKPLRAVYGNIDGGIMRRTYREFLSFECEGVSVLMTHIGGYPPPLHPAGRSADPIAAPENLHRGALPHSQGHLRPRLRPASPQPRRCRLLRFPQGAQRPALHHRRHRHPRHGNRRMASSRRLIKGRNRSICNIFI
jgi:hypothetical protein